MPQQAAVSIENNFKGGLITEATGLNFPENACTETYDCEFNLDGSVNRRLGFDFEAGFSTKTINRTSSVVRTYLWKNVAGNGDVTVLVVQIGLKIYFYEIIADASYSAGAVDTTVTLTPVAGSVNPELSEAQFSDGNGYLFITHPNCDPVRVAYNITTSVATATSISLQIRDFEGATADPYGISERPTISYVALNINHQYNLYNQGWSVANLGAWDAAQTTMPSNADVMWAFTDSSGNFDASNASIARITAGNTPAPRGHFIVDVANQNRAAVAGTSGVASTTSGSARPSTSSFFAGRIWYAGIRYVGFNSKIYFSQIIERDDQYGKAYQVNDPTSEDLFDLLPSDGGVISIPEAGTIHKLVSVTTGMCVFAENGVWFITGSTGVGFRANDYSILKISNIPTLTASSFVTVNGYPIWWNAHGIYLMTAGKGSLETDTANNSVSTRQGVPEIKSLTDTTILSFFSDIPLSSKKHAQGVWHYLDNHVRWVYRSTPSTEVTHIYEYDRVLNLNLITGSFYPWTISTSDVKVNAIVVSDVASGNISIDNVVDSLGNNVVDDLGNQVIAFSSTGTETSPFDKYLVSYPNAGSFDFTFADKINASFKDWFQFDVTGVNYDSYFVTGYKIRGQAIRKFQSNWVRIFSEMSEDHLAYFFQGLWDYASTNDSGRWSAQQLIEHNDIRYGVASKRIKVRGHGLALQFKVTSVPSEPFDIIGWSALESGNASP